MSLWSYLWFSVFSIIPIFGVTLFRSSVIDFQIKNFTVHTFSVGLKFVDWGTLNLYFGDRISLQSSGSFCFDVNVFCPYYSFNGSF